MVIASSRRPVPSLRISISISVIRSSAWAPLAISSPRRAFQFGDVAFQRQHARRLHQPAFQQRLLVLQFGIDQRNAPFQREALGFDALDLGLDLVAALFKLGDFLVHRIGARVEQAELALDHVGDLGPGCRDLDQFGFEHDGGGIVTLGFEPTAPGDQLEKLAFDDRQARFQQGRVQPHQDIARLHTDRPRRR